MFSKLSRQTFRGPVSFIVMNNKNWMRNGVGYRQSSIEMVCLDLDPATRVVDSSKLACPTCGLVAENSYRYIKIVAAA